MLPGEFLTHCHNKKLDWSAANIMLASILMWASSAPMMLLILSRHVGDWCTGENIVMLRM